MSPLVVVYGAGATLVLLLALLAVLGPRPLWWRWGAVTLAAAFVGLGLFAFGELAGRPKPVALAWFEGRTREATVLAHLVREGEGIYLWLQLGGVPEPRAYVLPWDRRTAEELLRAAREAEERRSGLAVRLPFEPSLEDREPRFYPLPQPALPPKEMLDPPAWFRRPGADA
ncbi:hypothetical protein HRbin39_00647 [bacterium HR39]|nr:hypothetical protein HRbin39_00647 [bacterium HR39]